MYICIYIYTYLSLYTYIYIYNVNRHLEAYHVCIIALAKVWKSL